MEISEHLNIPDVEKENINLLAEIIYGLTNGKANLEVVGGVISKPWPRKDIDLVIKMPKETGATELIRAQKSITRLEKLVGLVEEVSDGYFSRGSTRDPEIDRYVQSGDDILQHTGSVTVIPSSGTDIELIRV